MQTFVIDICLFSCNILHFLSVVLIQKKENKMDPDPTNDFNS